MPALQRVIRSLRPGLAHPAPASTRVRLVAVLAVLLGLLVTNASAIGRTWRILPDGSGDAPSIPAGIDSAAYGDSVLVGPGRYYIPTSPDVVIPDGVVVTSEAGPAQTFVVKVVDSGCRPAFAFVDAGPDTELSGLTIEAVFCSFPAAVYAARCLNSSPRIERLVVWDWGDWADEGAVAVWAQGTSQPVISHCTFRTPFGVVADAGTSPRIELSILVCRGSIFMCTEPGASIVSSCNDLWGGGGSSSCVLSTDDFSADPRFCNPDDGDFSLDCDSPAVHGFGCGLIGALGIGCGVSSTESTTWGRMKQIFR